jgi:hypothetical protein
MFRFGAEMVAEKKMGFSYSLQSLWPINKQNLPKTALEKKGLEAVDKDNTKPFYGEETLGKTKYFTAIYADKANEPPTCLRRPTNKDTDDERHWIRRSRLRSGIFDFLRVRTAPIADVSAIGEETRRAGKRASHALSDPTGLVGSPNRQRLYQPCDILPEKIVLYIHRVADLTVGQCRNAQRVRNHRDIDRVPHAVKTCQADAIDRYRAFLDGTTRQRPRDGERVNRRFALGPHTRHAPGPVNMTRDQMSADPIAEAHCAFEIDAITDPEPPEGRSA